MRLQDEPHLDGARTLARSACPRAASGRTSSPPGRAAVVRDVAHEEARNPDTSELELLLVRMRGDDRDAAAAFMDRYGPRIRRRIRGKLSPAMRRIFDSQEILSTLSRRLDLYVRDGRLAAMTEAQLWALVFRMADHAVIDKARVFSRLQRVEDEDGPLAREVLRRINRIDEARHDAHDAIVIEIERVMTLLPNETDRHILALWMDGARSDEIADRVDLTPAAVRKRWERIRHDLRDRLAGS